MAERPRAVTPGATGRSCDRRRSVATVGQRQRPVSA